MKKILFTGAAILLVAAIGFLIPNSKTNPETAIPHIEETLPDQAETGSQSSAELSDLCPAVMVNGILYFDTGMKDDGPRCGMLDGTIAASCPGHEFPTEDNQSNFGSGYGYQYGRAGIVEIRMDDGSWYVFAAEETGNRN